MQQDDKQLKKNTKILYLLLGCYKRPLFKESRPEIPRRKEKGRYKLLLYQKGATTAVEELERDVASWTLDFNKKMKRMLAEREIFLEVKRTRDQLHGPELESTLERL